MKEFRTYQLAMSFTRQCRGVSLASPYKDQFERAVLSIPLNLAEGSAKPTKKDQRKFYFIALGSLRETQCLIELLNLEALVDPADKLGAHLYRLCHQS